MRKFPWENEGFIGSQLFEHKEARIAKSSEKWEKDQHLGTEGAGPPTKVCPKKMKQLNDALRALGCKVDDE